MRNLLVEICYNGANYHGYQVQANGITVAQTVQDAVEQVLKVREPITGCSRTDAGVHANSFYFHMKTERRIPCENLIKALNCALPGDIAVLSCKEVPLDFHARYSCKGKEYVYKLWNAPVKNPFLEHLAAFYPYPVDEGRLDRAAKDFIGTHDFTAFCAAGGKKMDATRTIYDFTVRREGDLVLFTVRGNGFLYNMVRIMVGTLLKIQEGKIPFDGIPRILKQKNRALAGNTAKAEGLYLNRVFYDDDIEQTEKNPCRDGDEGFGKGIE